MPPGSREDSGMDTTRKLWLGLAALLAASFAVLLWIGGEIHREAPPIPERVVTADGEVVYTRAMIETGRQVWQSTGGQQQGSIWGHGGYVAPDWTADWLHREALALADLWAQREHGVDGYAALAPETQAAYRERLARALRTNTWDPASRTITIDADRARAIAAVAAHYDSLYGTGSDTASLREAYAMKDAAVPDPEHRAALAAFYWWTAWAAVTERPGKDVTYTNNWPADELVGNAPPASAFVWTVFSVLFLIA